MKEYEIDTKKGVFKVHCIFKRRGEILLDKMCQVDDAKFHFEAIRDPVTSIVVDNKLVLESGIIRLHDLGEAFFAQGTPPLVYGKQDPVPLEVINEVT